MGYRAKGIFFVFLFVFSGCVSLPEEGEEALSQVSSSPTPRPSIAPTPTPTRAPTPTPTRVPASSPTPTPTPMSGCNFPVFGSGVQAGVTNYRYSGTTTAPYGFIEYLPAGYSNNCKWPVIVMLHGLGEQGDGRNGNLQRVAVHGPNRLINQGRHFPAIVITPQSPGWWNSGTLDQMMSYILSNYSADPDRIYLTGLSMGGGGTWDYARAYPTRLAAIIPICGASGTDNSLSERRALDRVAMWVFHSINDGTVGSGNSDGFLNNWAVNYSALNQVRAGYNNTLDMTAHLNSSSRLWEWASGRTQLGPSGQSYSLDVHYTLYKDSSHDSWTRSYDDNQVWVWLLSKRRKP